MSQADCLTSGKSCILDLERKGRVETKPPPKAKDYPDLEWGS